MSVAVRHVDAGTVASGRLTEADLHELMRACAETTERLHETHTTLTDEVVRLRAELREANRQLRRSRSLAALGEMAAGIAHEIRNPLGSIQLYVQVLAEDLAGAGEPEELCRKIDGSVRTLDGIVRDVLLFAREMRIQPAPTSAAALLREAVKGAEGLLVAAGVEATLVDAGESESCRLRADAGLVIPALGNLIRNAVEAMQDGDGGARRITLDGRRRRVRCPDGRTATRIVLAVEDTGPGIPPEVVDRMFNPFFTTRRTGTGLGLAIVHRIVDAHGGHVSVQSADHGGARVELCLPARPPAPDAVRTAGEAA